MRREKPVRRHRHENSILFGQKERGHAAIPLRDDPECVFSKTLAGFVLVDGIGGQDAISFANGFIVCFPVFFANAAPIAAHMAAKAMNQTRLAYLGKRAGCRDDLPQSKQWWCVVHGNLPKVKVNESRTEKL